jgi:hypothetical protein
MSVESNEPIEHVHFPENALGSIVAIGPCGRRIEVGGRDISRTESG